MPRIESFKLPDLGEGLTEGEILQWLVAAGDEVKLNQPIVEVETAKAAVEVPSPFAGIVTTLHFTAGEIVDVGAVIITFDTDPGAGPLDAAAGSSLDTVTDAHPEVGDMVPPPPAAAAAAAAAAAPAPVEQLGALIGEVGPTGRTATLVGYGPKSVVAKRRARAGSAAGAPTGASAATASAAGPGPSATAASVPVATAPAPGVPASVAPGSVQSVSRAPVATASVAPVRSGAPATAALVQSASNGASNCAAALGGSVLAKPPVRKLAKDLGIDLRTLVATGPHGTISRDDVQAAAAGTPIVESPRTAEVFDEQRERLIPVKGVRKMTAQAMIGSAFSAPHVTEFLTLDMTASMELLPRLKAMPEFAGVKVTPLLLVAKALLLAVKRNPEINSTYTDEAIVVKDYVNLGIAAATPRGLLVPNIKNAEALSLADLARALQALTETAREGKTSPAEMARGTITITNVGVFGVDSGTPIINPGESAILCFGAVRPTPWVHDGVIAIRQVTTLSLSFDHRNIDGQLGSQFLADIARVLADPATALAWG